MSVSDRERQGNAGSGGVSSIIESANGDQAISADGRWVAFVSNATNLIPGTTQPSGRLYLRDRQERTTMAIPWASGQAWPAGVTAAEPAISAHGEVVAFTVILTPAAPSISLTVPPGPMPIVLAWDRGSGTELVSRTVDGKLLPGYQPSVSGDGRYVAYTEWAPEVEPTPTPDTTPPTVSNLTSEFIYNCLSYPGTVTISVDAVGAVGVILYYRPQNWSSNYVVGMFFNTSTGHWEGDIVVPEVWTDAQNRELDYWVQAYDENNNYSSELHYSGDYWIGYSEGGCVL